MSEERQRAEGREAALMAQKEEVLALLATERRGLAAAKREAGAAHAHALEQAALARREASYRNSNPNPNPNPNPSPIPIPNQASYREAEQEASRTARRETEQALLREQGLEQQLQQLQAKADAAALAAVRRLPTPVT